MHSQRKWCGRCVAPAGHEHEASTPGPRSDLCGCAVADRHRLVSQLDVAAVGAVRGGRLILLLVGLGLLAGLSQAPLAARHCGGKHSGSTSGGSGASRRQGPASNCGCLGGTDEFLGRFWSAGCSRQPQEQAPSSPHVPTLWPNKGLNLGPPNKVQGQSEVTMSGPALA